MTTLAMSVYPRDFARADLPMDPGLGFVLSPIKPEFESFYQAVQAVLAEFGFRCVRSDKLPDPGVIHAAIWEHIRRAAVIIADVSEPNPNVYYELGVATSWKHPTRVILLRNQSSEGTLPFNIAPIRYITYTSEWGEQKLRERLGNALSAIRSDDEELWGPKESYQAWKDQGLSHQYLLDKAELWRLERFPGIENTDTGFRGFCLSSSLMNSHHMGFWTDLNTGNDQARDGFNALFKLRYRGPRYRAAFALRFFSPQVRNLIMTSLRHLDSSAEDHQALLDAVESDSVREFLRPFSTADPRVADILQELDHWHSELR